MHRVVATGLTAAACVWLIALVAAPLALSGGVLPIPTMVTYQAASHVCHQRPERSFHVAGVQTPVCGRCLGLYVAGALGALAVQVAGRRGAAAMPGRGTLLISALPMVLSVALEWSGVAEGTNLARLISALPFGFVAGWILIGQMIATDNESAPSPA